MANGKVKKNSDVEKIEVADEDVIVTKVDDTDKDEEIEGKVQEVHYAHKVLWTLLITVEVLLFLKFTLEFMEANPDSVFFDFVQFITAPFMFPFERLFKVYEVTLVGYEINTIFAMFVYFLLAVIISQVIRLFRPMKETD